jgi:hypothetical protein
VSCPGHPCHVCRRLRIRARVAAYDAEVWRAAQPEDAELALCDRARVLRDWRAHVAALPVVNVEGEVSNG